MKLRDLYEITSLIGGTVDGNKVNTSDLSEQVNEDPDSYAITSVNGNHITTSFGEFIIAGTDTVSLLVAHPDWKTHIDGEQVPATTVAVMLVPADDTAAASMESIRSEGKVHYSEAPAVKPGAIYIVLLDYLDDNVWIIAVYDLGTWYQHIEEVVADIKSELLPIPHLVDQYVAENAITSTKEDVI